MDSDVFLSLPIEQKIGQLFFIGLPGSEVDSETQQILQRIKPGGICLFARNIKTREQTRKYVEDCGKNVEIPMFFGIDQEGGTVDRLRRILTPMPAASTIPNAAKAAELGEIIGKALTILGLNVDFAPVVDVITNERVVAGNGLFSRAFGDSAETVSELAGAFLEALQSNDVFGCLKHFPGLGAARVDSHEDLPQVEITEEEFFENDVLPYQKLAENAVFVMVAHAAFPNIGLQERDAGGKLLPSSLSKSFIDGLLRKRLGFDRLVITDDLEMGAILKNYGIKDAVKMAVDAGCDQLCICATPQVIFDAYDSILSGVRSGEISVDRIDESLRRIFEVKKRLQKSPAFDNSKLDELSAQIEDLKSSI